jgi:hypothetical protein
MDEDEVRALVENAGGEWRPDTGHVEIDPSLVREVTPLEPERVWTGVQVRLMVEQTAVNARASAVAQVMAEVEAGWDELRQHPYRPDHPQAQGEENPTIDALLRAIRLRIVPQEIAIPEDAP